MEYKKLDDPHALPLLQREAVYRTIFSRRDVRAQFLSDSIPDEVLVRILTAAHYAPSVGFMQPWNFIVIRSPEIKQQVHAKFEQANTEAAMMFEGERREMYQSLKLEGILEAPINLCITCDRDRAGPVVIGRTHIRAMDVFSSVCAAQNLWLAARAEGLGVGWVSILHPDALYDILEIPRQIIPVAYMCIGYVSHFKAKPELETAGWRMRLPLGPLICHDKWGGEAPEGDQLDRMVREFQSLVERGALK